MQKQETELLETDRLSLAWAKQTANYHKNYDKTAIKIGV